VCAKFSFGPLRIKKALGIFFEKGNNNPNNNNRRSDLEPFPDPKTRVSASTVAKTIRVSTHVQWTNFKLFLWCEKVSLQVFVKITSNLVDPFFQNSFNGTLSSEVMTIDLTTP